MEPENLHTNMSYFIVVFGPPASGKSTLANQILQSFKKSQLGLTIQLISADCCEEYLRTHSTPQLQKLLSKGNGWHQLNQLKLKRSAFNAELWKKSRNFIKQSIQHWLKKWNILILEDDLLLKSQRKQMRQLIQHSETKYIELYCRTSLEQCISNLQQRSKQSAEDEQISFQTVKECFDKFQKEETLYSFPFQRQTPISWHQIQKLAKKVIIQHPEEKQSQPVSEECQAKDQVQSKIRTFISEIITDSNLRKNYFGDRPVKEVAGLLSKIKKGLKEKDKTLEGFIKHLQKETTK